jgi:hypothetical protein
MKIFELCAQDRDRGIAASRLRAQQESENKEQKNRSIPRQRPAHRVVIANNVPRDTKNSRVDQRVVLQIITIPGEKPAINS